MEKVLTLSKKSLVKIQYTDDSTIKIVNSKSIKLYSTSEINATLDLTIDFPSGIDIKNKKLEKLVWSNYRVVNGSQSAYYFYWLRIRLVDTNDDKIEYQFTTLNQPSLNQWNELVLRLGTLKTNGMLETERIHSDYALNRWLWVSPSTTFNWIIKKIIFLASPCWTGENSKTLYVDGVHFEGVIEINPIKDPDLAAKDQTSINTYGRSLMHYDEPAIRDYASIYALASKVLSTTKDPVKKLKTKVGAKTWIKPNQYVTINMPIYGISSQQYRIVEAEYEWSTKTKLLRSTLGLTPRTQPVTSREWYAGQLEGILKNLIW